MKKSKGLWSQETQNFIDFIKKGREEGISLSTLFSKYAEISGRAKGSVRNFYYSLLKKSREDKNFEKEMMLAGLKAGKIVNFDKEQEEELLDKIFTLKKGERSLRSVLSEISGGEPKLMLRLQNKYRNLLKSDKELVMNKAKICKAKNGYCFDPYTQKAISFLPDSSLKKLKDEINSLYDRCTLSLKKENQELKERLKEAEDKIRLLESGDKIKNYFSGVRKKELLN